ncbi:MAG TPA: hypothetical protein VJK49_07635 [Candidatus Limnocylindrales bacterium]|nr:hypothetical protein [Candidatus Limnocylindrales bacterium]
MAAEAASQRESPRRIFIIGAIGSGKSTLARELGNTLDLPVHGLDSILREGGGGGPARPVDVRVAELALIADQPSWIVEGVHLDDTEPLMARAELIVWLDHLRWWRSSARVVRRFVSGAWVEVRRRRGRERFLRFGDYGRRLRELGGAIGQSRGYAINDSRATPVTRAAVAGRLSRFGDKVLRCTSEADVDNLLRRLRPATARSP